jgi:hypothetical protein
MQSRTVDDNAGILPFKVERRYSSLPATLIAHEHPATIHIDVNHDGRPIGLVEHLHRDGRGSIWAVGWVDDNAGLELEHMAYSVDARRRPGDDWQIVSVAVTTNPGMTCVGRLHVIDDAANVDELASKHITRTRTRNPYVASLLEHAQRTAKQRRAGQPMTLHYDGTHDSVGHPGERGGAWTQRQPSSRADANGIWRRGGGYIISVR